MIRESLRGMARDGGDEEGVEDDGGRRVAEVKNEGGLMAHSKSSGQSIPEWRRSQR